MCHSVIRTHLLAAACGAAVVLTAASVAASPALAKSTDAIDAHGSAVHTAQAPEAPPVYGAPQPPVEAPAPPPAADPYPAGGQPSGTPYPPAPADDGGEHGHAPEHGDDGEHGNHGDEGQHGDESGHHGEDQPGHHEDEPGHHGEDQPGHHEDEPGHHGEDQPGHHEDEPGHHEDEPGHHEGDEPGHHQDEPGHHEDDEPGHHEDPPGDEYDQPGPGPGSGQPGPGNGPPGHADPPAPGGQPTHPAPGPGVSGLDTVLPQIVTPTGTASDNPAPPAKGSSVPDGAPAAAVLEVLSPPAAEVHLAGAVASGGDRTPAGNRAVVVAAGVRTLAAPVAATLPFTGSDPVPLLVLGLLLLTGGLLLRRRAGPQ
jgi:hypothetical protein